METIDVVTPNAIKAVLKKGLTAGEFRELRSMVISDATVEPTTDEEAPKVSGIKGEIIEKLENKTLELIVLELDGSKENILKRLLELDYKEYEVIWNAVQEVTAQYEQKKTK